MPLDSASLDSPSLESSSPDVGVVAVPDAVSVSLVLDVVIVALELLSDAVCVPESSPLSDEPPSSSPICFVSPQAPSTRAMVIAHEPALFVVIVVSIYGQASR